MERGKFIRSEEWKRKQSESHRGKPSGREGKYCSTESKKRMSKAAKNRWEHKEYREKMIKRLKDNPAGKGHTVSDIHKEKISKANKGKIFSQEHKKKMRLSAIMRIEKNYGICYPGYNKNACEYFKKFDIEYNTKGRYAMYGGGEYKIEELGYWVDYINFDLKLIIEYDESLHYVKGQLREKDKIRQKEIQKLYYDFEFRRIKEIKNDTYSQI